MNEDVVLTAALVRPGFSPDLSTWRLTIDRAGHLLLDIVFLNEKSHFREEQQHFESMVDPAEIALIVTLAKEIGYQELPDQCGVSGVDDLPTSELGVFINGKMKTVEIYGLGFREFHKNEPYLENLLQLWNRICEHAPFPEPSEADEVKEPGYLPWHYRIVKFSLQPIIPVVIFLVGMIWLLHCLPDTKMVQIGIIAFGTLAMLGLLYLCRYIEERFLK